MRGVHTNGSSVQSARAARGMTQEQLAAAAGLDPKTIRKAESGSRLDLGTLSKLSFALDVDVSFLAAPPQSPNELEIRRRDAVIRWNRGFESKNIELMLSIYRPDAVLHLPGGPGIPFAGENRGLEAIRSASEIAWATCETVKCGVDEYSLLVSAEAVVLSGKKGVRLPNGHIEKLWCLQIFTFEDGTDRVIDHRVEYDTLRMAQLLGFTNK